MQKMSLRHLLFHRTTLALLLDLQESGYELPTLENRKAFQDELIQELEVGILPIIEKNCYKNPPVTRNHQESNLPKC